MGATVSKPKGKSVVPQRRSLDKRKYSHRVAARIRQFREQEGLSVEDLAERVGKSAATIYAWEAGATSPRMDDVPTLLRALKVNVSEFFPPPPR